MTKSSRIGLFTVAVVAVAAAALAQSVDISASNLDVKGVQASAVTYKGRSATRLVETDSAPAADRKGLALLRNLTFRDGTIELWVAGAPRAQAAEGARGFVGMAFRVSQDAASFEHVYLRPTNGRADDQVRRNHSIQYMSAPDYPWPRLRQEFPERYEAYVDLEPGVWTRMRIVVKGTTARVYVHDASQPTLIVNDLKLGEREGRVALWIGPGTEGHFADVSLRR